jgi:hypothetical protein
VLSVFEKYVTRISKKSVIKYGYTYRHSKGKVKNFIEKYVVELCKKDKFLTKI